MSEEKLDKRINDIKSPPKCARLFQLLSQQLELLINEGHPNLHLLYASLETEDVVSKKELSELRASFALDAVS